MTLLTTQANVSLIAPELLAYIYGQAQKTRIYVQSTSDNVLKINDKTYTYDVQPTDDITDVIDGLIALIVDDTYAEVGVVNTTDEYFDVVGLDYTAYTVYSPTSVNILEAVSDALFTLIGEDVDDMVNEDTFVSQIERAQRYLIAHLLKLHSQALGSIQALSSEKVGDISVSYADPMSDEGLGLTGYGVIYKGIYLKQRRIQYIPASLKNYIVEITKINREGEF